MKTDIWMPIYIGDYLKDTRFLSLEEHGAYLLILMEMWNRGGSIPFKNLHRVVIINEEKFQKIWVNISCFFVEKDGEITQKRLKKEYIASQKRRKSAKNNGLKGGRPKTQKKPIGKPMGNRQGNRNETSSPLPTPIIKLPFNNKEFCDTWDTWKRFRAQVKSKLTPITEERQLKMLSQNSVDVAIKILNQSMVNGWKGLFPLQKENNNGTKWYATQQRDEYKKSWNAPMPEDLKLEVGDIPPGNAQD